MSDADWLNYENEWLLLKAEQNRLNQIVPKNDHEIKQNRQFCIENNQRMITLEKLKEKMEFIYISKKKKFLIKKLVEAKREKQNITQVRPNNIIQQQQLIEVSNNNATKIQNIKDQLAELS